jgi:hypothetical protein
MAHALLFAWLLAAAQDPPPTATTPPSIAWQRTLADALAVQQATGLPLLIAVNMDGEVFNERFANHTYRDPAFVTSTQGYVGVVASPDRHTERDYDHRGRRVECPRFPGCTCSEHQAIEPELFRRWFGGRRNAPRHLGVAADGTILFDRYLDASMQTAIDAIAKHRGTPPQAEFAPRDARRRRQLESRYQNGDPATRRALLQAAATATDEPADLLRMGLRESDPGLLALAAQALAATAGPSQIIDLEDALARELPAPTTHALLARLALLAERDPAAQRLQRHWQAKAELPAPWRAPWPAAPFDAADRDAIDAALDAAESQRRAADTGATQCAVAAAQLALGQWLAAYRGKHAESWFDDAARTAAAVADPAWLGTAQAVVAVARWQRNDAAGARAAVDQVLASTGPTPDAWLARQFGAVAVPSLAAAAFARLGNEPTSDLTPELGPVAAWLDLLLARQAIGDGPALAGIALLESAGLRRRATALLLELAAQFPASPAVHERLRQRLWIDQGPEAMWQGVAAWAAAHPAQGAGAWFAGYAALVAAEQHQRDGEPASARAAYDTAIAQFAASRAANAEFADSADHHAVLARVGRAVLRQRANDLDGAARDLLAAAALRPASFAERDGLQQQGREVAQKLAAALQASGQADLAKQLAELGQ